MSFLSWTSQTWLSLSLHLSPSQVEMLSLHKQVQKFTSSLFLLCFLILTSSQTRSFTCSLLFASPLLLLHSFTSCWQTIVCLSSFFLFFFWLILLRFASISSLSLPVGHSIKPSVKCRSSPLLPPPPSSPDSILVTLLIYVPLGNAAMLCCNLM